MGGDPEEVAKQNEKFDEKFDVNEGDCPEACQKARNDVLAGFDNTNGEDAAGNGMTGVGNGINGLTSAVSTSPNLLMGGPGFGLDFGGIFNFFNLFG